MRDLNILAFDDIVAGTSTTWYTPSPLNEALGTADVIVLHAVPTMVSGTSPTLTCTVEHSADGRSWNAMESAPAINAAALVTGTSLLGTGTTNSPLQRVRVKITLGGTSPQCRLKLYATTRLL